MDSMKRSAETSDRRKSGPLCSAMSMLTFCTNRAGKTLSARQSEILAAAKARPRQEFGKHR
jgi:hypothetical protein